MMTEVTHKEVAKKVAKLTFENGKYFARYNGKTLASSSSKEYVINKIRNRDCERAKAFGVFDVEDEHHFLVEGRQDMHQHDVHTEESMEFPINTRFEMLETLVKMIVMKNIPSLVITGEGGLGKTFTVKKVLKDHNLEDTSALILDMQKDAAEEAALQAAAAKKASKKKKDADDEGEDEDADFEMPTSIYDRKNPGDYIFIKGTTTAKSLYRILFENRDKIVIFDDCDSVFKNSDAVNLIKAAADSYDDRWVSWYSETMGTSDLPKTFRFDGQIIFISNMSYHSVDQAIRSRSMCVDLSMDTDQKIERMVKIIESGEFMTEFDDEHKKDALDFLIEKRHVVRDLTLRSLIAVTKIRAGGADNWMQLAEYIVRTN